MSYGTCEVCEQGCRRVRMYRVVMGYLTMCGPCARRTNKTTPTDPPPPVPNPKRRGTT